MDILVLHQLRVALLHVGHHPSFVLWQNWVFPGLLLHLHKRLRQELAGENGIAVVVKAVGMSLEEHVVDFIEFVVDEFGEVELSGEAMVVGLDGGEIFDLGDSAEGLNFGDDDLLFFLDGGGGGFRLCVDGDDELIFVGFEFVEVGFGVNKFEGFGPVELFSSMGAHGIKKMIIIWKIDVNIYISMSIITIY